MSGLIAHRGLLLAGNAGPVGLRGAVLALGPAAMYAFRDLSTLFQDSAGTAPVTASGQPVGRILNLGTSGSGADWIQPTSGVRPVYTEESGTGLLDFDGTQYMESSANSALAFATVNAFLRGRKTAGFADYGPFVGHPYAATHVSPFWDWTLQLRTGGYGVAYYFGGSGRIDVTTSRSDAGLWCSYETGICALANPAGSLTQLQFYTNGIADIAGPGVVAVQTYPNVCKSTLGSHAQGVVPGKMSQRGIVVMNRAVTLAETSTIAAWLDADCP